MSKTCDRENLKIRQGKKMYREVETTGFLLLETSQKTVLKMQ